jgi:hypothetical protein
MLINPSVLLAHATPRSPYMAEAKSPISILPSHSDVQMYSPNKGKPVPKELLNKSFPANTLAA